MVVEQLIFKRRDYALTVIEEAREYLLKATEGKEKQKAEKLREEIGIAVQKELMSESKGRRLVERALEC